MLVENKPGAASNIATEAVVNAPPDGYTLGSVTSANAINATVNKRTLGFDYLKQLAPVAGMSQGPSVMVVNPAVPATSVAEFIAYAKANPGKLNMGTPGVGSTGHLAGELFKATAGVDLVHIPYRGAAPAMTDLIGGQVQVMFDSMVTVLPHVQGGRVRALAVTSAARSPLLPDLPAIAETVPGYEAIIWFGVGVPRGTPPEVVAVLNREINAGARVGADEGQACRARHDPIIATPDEFWRFATSRDREVGEGDPAGRHQGGLTADDGQLLGRLPERIHCLRRFNSACGALVLDEALRTSVRGSRQRRRGGGAVALQQLPLAAIELGLAALGRIACRRQGRLEGPPAEKQFDRRIRPRRTLAGRGLRQIPPRALGVGARRRQIGPQHRVEVVPL